MLPLIGLTAAVNADRDTTLLCHYAYAIEKAGGLPTVLPYLESTEALDAFVDRLDGIFLTGGFDIAPCRYGEEIRPTCGELQPERDSLELALLERAIERGKPILAVCRGLQLVNVFFGGTLYQDIPTEYETALCHRQTESRFSPSHDILIKAGTPLAELVGTGRMTGNSFHHQAVKRLGDGLLPMATAEDGLLEGFYAPTYPYLRAYQWHPERLYDLDEKNRLLFADFLAATKQQ